jgi:hypothetical protein
MSWDAMLKMTGIELDLISDIDKYLMIEKGIRGGVSSIMTRHSQANNKYMKNFDANESVKFINYFDANNLYGWAMSQKMPYGDFEWVEVTSLDDLDSNYGYILEVDLRYPSELHNLHNDYPLAPEKIKIKKEYLSNYSKTISSATYKAEYVKLVPNLYDKTRYTVHYKNLLYYVKKGMVVTKIHRALRFKESFWLKKYIDFNTEKRKLAKSDFEKDFYKLMNNSVFGKTMENVRNRIDFRLINDEKKRDKLVKKPTFESIKIYNEHLVGINMFKTKVVLNKPIYIGFAILDLSKLLMYQFHYDFIKEKYDTKAKLLFTDTDSLCYEFTGIDMYREMQKYKDYFDLSNFSPDFKLKKWSKATQDRQLFDNTNKKVIGKFKDESPISPIIEFCGLRAKMYSMLTDNAQTTQKAKGIQKSAIKRDLKHEKYLDVLFNKVSNKVEVKSIRSYMHDVKTVASTKTGLSCYDDKRYILDDGINTLSYGHCRITK